MSNFMTVEVKEVKLPTTEDLIKYLKKKPNGASLRDIMSSLDYYDTKAIFKMFKNVRSSGYNLIKCADMYKLDANSGKPKKDNEKRIAELMSKVNRTTYENNAEVL